MKVNEQLGKVYDEKFPVLLERLERDGLRENLQPPFLLGIERFNAKGNKTGDEDWYTKADLKVMFFGKEPNEWGWREPDEGQHLIADDIVEGYEEFYGANYTEEGFRTDTDNSLTKSAFFRGMSQLMSGIVNTLHQDYPNREVAFLWNEISKLSKMNKRRAVSQYEHSIESSLFKVIPSEIRILKPDIIIFLTGITMSQTYDNYIKENFNEKEGYPILNEEALPGVDIADVLKLEIQGIHLAYKTHHPQGLKKDDQLTQYNAICADIKAHLGEIIK